jgi:hypothetical protein
MSGGTLEAMRADMAETRGQTLKPAFWHNSLKHSCADHKAVRKQKSKSTAPASEAGK